MHVISIYVQEAVVRQIHSYVEFSNILEQACCAVSSETDLHCFHLECAIHCIYKLFCFCYEQASEDSSDYKEGPLVVLEVGTTHCRFGTLPLLVQSIFGKLLQVQKQY